MVLQRWSLSLLHHRKQDILLYFLGTAANIAAESLVLHKKEGDCMSFLDGRIQMMVVIEDERLFHRESS
jgi:hypothetical protein